MKSRNPQPAPTDFDPGIQATQFPETETGETPVTDMEQGPDLATLQAELAELKDQHLRAQAEVLNARRRADEEVQKARKFGIESFAESLLPVLDSLEAGLAVPNATVEQIREGSEATLRQLLSALERNKVVVVNPAQGDKFDPSQHQAISVVPAPQGVSLPGNSINNVLQKGYLIADRVLRPALVTVTPA